MNNFNYTTQGLSGIGTLVGDLIAKTSTVIRTLEITPASSTNTLNETGMTEHTLDVKTYNFGGAEITGIDVYLLISGKSYFDAAKTSKTAMVTLKSFNRGGGYKPDGLKAYTGNYKPEQVLKTGELVIACTDVTQNAEVVGRPAIIQKSRDYSTLVASLDTIIIRPKSKDITLSYIYFLELFQ